MRKLFVVLIAALIVPATASAQMQSFGLKAGTNFAKVAGGGGSSDSMTGLNFGLFASFPAGSSLSIQPEALFSQKGFKINGGEIGSMTNKLTYLSVPVLAKMSFGGEGTSRPYIFAGPEVALLLTAKASAGGFSASIKDGFKSLDFGGTVGGGVELGKVSLDARYGLGLASIAEGGGSAKNRAITLMVGYSIR
jgi:hypothetical protein